VGDTKYGHENNKRPPGAVIVGETMKECSARISVAESTQYQAVRAVPKTLEVGVPLEKFRILSIYRLAL
jgi:hypothetical protein